MEVRWLSWLLSSVILSSVILTYPTLAGPGPSSAQEDSPLESTADWIDFRGPNRAGISHQADLARAWPPEGPAVLWRRALGEGFSGITVNGKFLYTLFAIDATEYLGCFRVADGKEVWRVSMGKMFVDEWGNGPRATPVIDGDKVYALAALGNLMALEKNSGKILWQFQLKNRFGPTPRPQNIGHFVPEGESISSEHGHASSPLIVDDLLIVYTGARNGKSVAALDKLTGTTEWAALDNGAGDTSPSLIEIGGQPQILLPMEGEVIALNTAGNILWRFPWSPVNAAQPIHIPPDRIYISTVFDIGAKMLQVLKSDEGAYTPNVLWEYRLMRNFWSSPVHYEGYIYGYDHATFKCLDATSGEPRWAKRGLGRGSLVIADGLLISLSDRGLLTFAEATHIEYRELGRLKVMNGQTLTGPTPARGKLLLRNHEEMVCLDMKANRPGQAARSNL